MNRVRPTTPVQGRDESNSPIAKCAILDDERPAARSAAKLMRKKIAHTIPRRHIRRAIYTKELHGDGSSVDDVIACMREMSINSRLE